VYACTFVHMHKCMHVCIACLHICIFVVSIQHIACTYACAVQKCVCREDLGTLSFVNVLTPYSVSRKLPPLCLVKGVNMSGKVILWVGVW
jgi:hypothetical protein